MAFPNGVASSWMSGFPCLNATRCRLPEVPRPNACRYLPMNRPLRATVSSLPNYLESGAELAGLGFYDVDFEAATTFYDERFRRLCGMPEDAEHGLGAVLFWREHIHPDDRARVNDIRDALQAGEFDRVELEYRYLHPELGERWLRHLAQVETRDSRRCAVRTFGVIRDITETKQVEADLRDLGRRLMQAHEDERASLARELHDDITQRLAILAIEVGRGEAADPATAREIMAAVREALVRLSEDVHALAYQLHPSVLQELGLAEALRTECERVGRRGELVPSLDIELPSGAIGRDQALCLFRVAQEALNNVVRHARARAASVVLHPAGGGMVLTVSDDGSGFPAEHAVRSRSLGLASMRERVRLAGGTLDVESAPGQGTRVRAWIPCGDET